MGNQCCSAVRYTEEQFNEMQVQRSRGGQIEQAYSRTMLLNRNDHIVEYILINNIQRTNTSYSVHRIKYKGMYEILLLIHDLFSIVEEENSHQLYVTENLISFFRNNPKQITNRLVADSLAELLSEQYTNQKIMLLIQESKYNQKNQNRNNSVSKFNNLQSMNGDNFAGSSIGNNTNRQNQLPQYTPINGIDDNGLPYYQPAYKDNSPIPNNYAQFSNDYQSVQTRDKIVDYEPITSNGLGYQNQQIHSLNHLNDLNMNHNRTYNDEEGQANNYSHRVYNNPNTIYKSGFQSPSKQEDIYFNDNNNNYNINNNSNLSSQINQLSLNTRQPPDQNIIQIIDYIMTKMGTHQLEQTSQKDIWQTWRVLDPLTGYMNFHKKYNLLYYGKQAMEIYQKEATILQQIEDAQINVAPSLMKYDAKNKEIKFEGGFCTLWELSIEMSKVQLRFTEKDLLYITLELVRMIIELDKLNIYHGNIKPQNIVLYQTAQGKYQIRLINFENSTKGLKEKYPNAKTENYYDIIHKVKVQSDFMSSQIYQIGRTILNLIVKQGANNNNLHHRKNHPIITQDTLKHYNNEYPQVINIITKMLRQASASHPSAASNNMQNNQVIQNKAGNGLSERNKDDQTQNSLGNNAILSQFAIVYTIQQLERDLSSLREAIKNGSLQSYIHDPQGLVKQITRRRIEMGAWDHSMTPDIFKREVLYILSLGQFERGCELCNYLLNYKSSPNYAAQANSINNNNSNINNNNNNNSIINNNNKTNSQLKNSGFNTQRGQTQDNPMLLNTSVHYLRNQVSTPLKQDINKYTGYQHEFLIKAQIVLKQLYFKQLPEIIQSYFHIKEELSLFFFSSNMLKEAIQEQENLISEKKNLVENDLAGLSRSLRILGEFQLRNNRFDQAIRFLSQSLNIHTQVFKDLHHIETAEILISMAEVYSQQNDQKRAIQSSIISYDISSQTSPNTLAFAEICIQISQIFMRVFKDHGKAIPYLEKGVKIKIDCFKSTFLNQYLDNNILQLASFYESAKNYAMAHEYYNILLDIRLQRLTPQVPTSPQVAQAYTLNGFILEQLNQIDKAQANHIKALTMRKQMYGEVHQEVADSLINLSMVHLRKNQFQESLTLQEQALKIKEKVMPDSADVAQCMNNLAIILETLGNFEEAIAYHKKSIVIKNKIYGEKSSSIATSYNNLALTYKNSGQHEKAIPLLNNALQIRSQSDPNSEEVISVLTNLQAINTDLGNQEQANKFKDQINRVQLVLQQKKDKNNKAYQQEEELIYRTSNPLAIYNPNQTQSNLNRSNIANNPSTINNSQNYPQNQQQFNPHQSGSLQNSAALKLVNNQSTFNNQAGQQSQQLVDNHNLINLTGQQSQQLGNNSNNNNSNNNNNNNNSNNNINNINNNNNNYINQSGQQSQQLSNNINNVNLFNKSGQQSQQLENNNLGGFSQQMGNANSVQQSQKQNQNNTANSQMNKSQFDNQKNNNFTTPLGQQQVPLQEINGNKLPSQYQSIQQHNQGATQDMSNSQAIADQLIQQPLLQSNQISGQQSKQANTSIFKQASKNAYEPNDQFNQGNNNLNQGSNSFNQGNNNFNQGNNFTNQGDNNFNQGNNFTNQGSNNFNQGNNLMNQGSGNMKTGNKNIFIPNQSTNNQNQQMQNSQFGNASIKGNQTSSQFQMNGGNNNQMNNNPLGLGEDIKNNNQNYSYQNNRPTQLHGNFDNNHNNQRA